MKGLLFLFHLKSSFRSQNIQILPRIFGHVEKNLVKNIIFIQKFMRQGDLSLG